MVYSLVNEKEKSERKKKLISSDHLKSLYLVTTTEDSGCQPLKLHSQHLLVQSHQLK